MIGQLSQISWPGVLLGGLAFSILGALWFLALFPRQYAAALGRTGQPEQKPGALFIAGPILCCFVITLTNAVLLQAVGAASYGAALELAACTGVGYLAPMTVTIAINPNFPRPLSYSAINVPYFLLGNLVNCLILTATS